jgi:DNA invertase Pin-like site-specific DNA recombinase
MTKYVAYFRVSTTKQGQSGLGLEAQQEAVKQYADSIIHSFTEIESGKNDSRIQLAAAIELCRTSGASLLIAKLDRLSRDAAFLMTIRKSGVDIVAADMPNASTLEFGIKAIFAQHEREEISKRTKVALAAAVARGVKLGTKSPQISSAAGVAALQANADQFAQKVLPIIRDLKAAGYTSLRQIAAALTERQVQTVRGSTNWSASQVSNIIAREAV